MVRRQTFFPRMNALALALAGGVAAGVVGGALMVALIVGVLAGVASLGGCCRSTVANQGRGQDIPATYSFCKLKADLPGEVSPLTVRAAAESAMRARGYIVTDAGGTRESAFITARVYPDRLGESITTTARATAHGTQIEIDPGFFGAESESRAVLDSILARLGR